MRRHKTPWLGLIAGILAVQLLTGCEVLKQPIEKDPAPSESETTSSLFPSKRKPVPLNVVILNKTVPQTTYKKHANLVSLLRQLDYPNNLTGEHFRSSEDYYGFFPVDPVYPAIDKNYEIKELPTPILPDVDLVYVADTYGVYEKDFYGIRGCDERHKKLMYGGLELPEAKALENAVLLNDTLLISEFNSFARPTEPNTRSVMEKLHGVQWTGWTGRYFSDLHLDNEELPCWLIENYEKQYKEDWAFEGPGLVLANLKGKVVILAGEEDLAGAPVRFDFKQVDKFPGLDPEIFKPVLFGYWFDVLSPVKETVDKEVLAQYTLNLTEAGQKKIAPYGLKPPFPAIVMRQHQTAKTYYFAGDFADSRPGQPFYTKAFHPLMKTILDEQFR